MGLSLQRKNFHGRKVSLLGGLALGAVLPVCQAKLAFDQSEAAGARVAVAALGSAAAGFFDDASDQDTKNKTTKGLRGHFSALKEGRVSPGLIKMLALIATAFLATKPRRDLLDWGAEAGVIAGGANLLNLLDLRPGRALKVAALSGIAGLVPSKHEAYLPRTRRVLVNLGGIAASLPTDLREITMLGDTGANALGAAVAATWVQGRSRGVKLLALAVIAGLTLASEKVSFSKIIETTPALKAFDDLGRLPA